ncbi:hypothetical protein [Bacillus haynesii]|uniref:hypothetical protein n=1 Tax=Bacillus haynesii TaxID=1925021 RepID=UPI00227F2A74|nr:hypothetical protein [Bacillus haynesii]MCY9324051.1 hypothetical protein [Bacillus haynesii]
MWAFSLKEKLIFVVILIAFIGITAFLCITTGNIDAEGKVQEKHFSKGTTSVGTGFASNGQIVTTVNNTYDEYIIFVDGEDISIDKDDWLKVKKGDFVKIEGGKVVEIKASE